MSGPAIQEIPGRTADSRHFTTGLTAVPAAASVARYKVRQILSDWQISASDQDTAVLLTSELVANAARWGQHPDSTDDKPSGIVLTVWLMPDSMLAIEVQDQNADAFPRPLPVGIGSESGRGLILISELSAEWWYYLPRPGWKTVYCVMAVSQQ